MTHELQKFEEVLMADNAAALDKATFELAGRDRFLDLAFGDPGQRRDLIWSIAKSLVGLRRGAGRLRLAYEAKFCSRHCCGSQNCVENRIMFFRVLSRA